MGRKSVQQAQASLATTVKELLASCSDGFLIHRTPDSTDDKAFHGKLTADKWTGSLTSGGISCKGGGKGVNAQAQIAVTPEDADETITKINSVLKQCAKTSL